MLGRFQPELKPTGVRIGALRGVGNSIYGVERWIILQVDKIANSANPLFLGYNGSLYLMTEKRGR